MNKARVMYFKLGKGYYFEPAEVAEKGLADLCTLIGCDLVEPVYFTVRGVEYTLWCDEEFLLKPNPVGTSNFIVCKCKGFYNKEGEHDEKIVSLTDEEIADIRALLMKGKLS